MDDVDAIIAQVVEGDHLNDIGVLKRREIEACVLAPIVAALAQEFDAIAVLRIVGETIRRIARAQGRSPARRSGGQSIGHLAASMNAWTRESALELKVLEKTKDRLSFDVTRCRYAELYRALGLEKLGAILSCNRDSTWVEGFSDEIGLTRTQTILEGAPCCDFRYQNQRRVSDREPKP